MFKKLDIQFTDDVEITQIHVSEGDEVNIGDSLFFYINEKSKDKVKSTRREVFTEQTGDNWIDREIIQTQKNIELAEINIAEAHRMISENNFEKEKVQKAVYLDLYHADKLDIYNQRALKLENQITQNSKEIEYLRKYLTLLYDKKKLANISRQTIVESGVGYEEQSVYTSPIKGAVTRINKSNYEVALQSDIVMSIHKPSNLYIKAFFEPRDVNYLIEGDLMKVIFPDGTESTGVVQRFYAATYELPDEFQKKYEPVTRSISAEIIPLNQLELEKWKAFYKLNVKVKKYKLPLLNSI